MCFFYKIQTSIGETNKMQNEEENQSSITYYNVLLSLLQVQGNTLQRQLIDVDSFIHSLKDEQTKKNIVKEFKQMLMNDSNSGYQTYWEKNLIKYGIVRLDQEAIDSPAIVAQCIQELTKYPCDTIQMKNLLALFYVRLGRVYEDTDFDKSFQSFSKALQLLPDFATPYVNQGVLYHAKEDYLMAITYYTQALSLDPDYTLALSNRAVAYYNRRRYDHCIQDTTKVLDIDPSDNVARRMRSISYYQCSMYVCSYSDAITGHRDGSTDCRELVTWLLPSIKEHNNDVLFEDDDED
jgi:tetratricopeptide (TPR) repeat protein